MLAYRLRKPMRSHFTVVVCLTLVAATCSRAVELHVAVTGDDSQAGSVDAPLRTIQCAAERAQPGDTVTVHAGIYRERINPPRGGLSDDRRITYRAAPGEAVEIRGSEVVKGWERVAGDAWTVALPNAFFGAFNPFADPIHGDWFDPRGRTHHTGAVYLNGEWLTEAAAREDVLMPAGAKPAWLAALNLAERGLNSRLWFAEVGEERTTIWAQFPGVDPNRERVEINVRQSVFYPDQPGRNFITVRGFALRHAATPWAPPTAEQIGLIGVHWSKGWIIEDNVISHSTCTGITLGKHGDRFDNTSANTAEGYVKTIERAHAFPIAWTKDNIGGHIVRRNTISHCEQAGIVGSLGAAFSAVEDNTIHEIHVRRLFGGAEMAGIKFHAAIDTTIAGNHIFRCCRGLWLDWMAQGTRVRANVFHHNPDQDLFLEVNHGPCLVDNNLFLSPTSLLDVSEGAAFAHNLFAGAIINFPEPNRRTPYHPPHSTAIAGLVTTQGGDNRFYNNVFVGTGKSDRPDDNRDARRRATRAAGLWIYDQCPLPLQAAGNVYYFGATPSSREKDAQVFLEHDPAIELRQQNGRLDVSLTWAGPAQRGPVSLVTTARLGAAHVSGAPYVDPDDSPVVIDRDFFGAARDPAAVASGPLGIDGPGRKTYRLR